MTLLLLLGVIMVPFQVGFLFAGEFSGLSLIAIAAMGIAGLVALFNVVRWLLIRPSYSLKPRVALLLMCVGCVPLGVFAVIGDTEVWRLLAALPLICTGHLAYLARDYLFATWSAPER